MDESEWKLSREESQKELEKRLLSGWTMIQDCCPITHFPLVEKGGMKYSIPMQCEVIFTSDKDENPLSSAKSKSISSSSNTNNNQETYSRRVPLSDENRKDDDDDYYYGFNGKKKNNEVGNSNISSKSNVRDAPTTSNSGNIINGPAKKKEKVQSISSLLGEKLLLGWTMLEEECPITHQCPLMRDHNGRLWSAGLNDYIDVEKEKPQPQQQQQKKELSTIDQVRNDEKGLKVEKNSATPTPAEQDKKGDVKSAVNIDASNPTKLVETKLWNKIVDIASEIESSSLQTEGEIKRVQALIELLTSLKDAVNKF